MRSVPFEAGFFLLLVGGVLALALLALPPVTGALCVLLALFPGMVLFRVRTWPDRAFYLTAAGQPAVVACGSTGVGAGLFAALMLAGMAAGTLGFGATREDLQDLLLLAGLLILLALAVRLASHVLLLLLVFGAGLGLLAGVLAIREYRFSKECAAGGEP